METREYLVGDIDGFGQPTEPSDQTPISSQFANRIGPYWGFDVLGTNRSVAFEVPYVLDPGDRVIHATLALSMRVLSSGVTTDMVETCGYLGGNLACSAPQTFDALGWLPMPSTPSEQRVLDLGDRLNIVNGAGLAVSVEDDVSVDFGLLSLTVAVPDASVWFYITIPQGADVRHDMSSDSMRVETWGKVRVRPATTLRTNNAVIKYGGALRMEGGTATVNYLETDGPVYVPATGGAASNPAPVTVLEDARFYANAPLVVLATGTLAANQVIDVVGVTNARVLWLPPAAYCYDNPPNWRYVPCRVESVDGMIRAVVTPRTTPTWYGEKILLRSDWWGTYLSASGPTLTASTTSASASSQWRLVRLTGSDTTVKVNGTQFAVQNVATGQYLAENGSAATMVSSITAAAKWRLLKNSCGCADGASVVPGAAQLWLEAVATTDRLKAMTTTAVRVLSGAGGYAKWRIYDAPLAVP